VQGTHKHDAMARPVHQTSVALAPRH
jgi:hypothetical protein